MRLLVFCLIAVSTLGLAFSQPRPRAETEELIRIGREYLETLYRFDFDSMPSLIADDIFFEDPTSTTLSPKPWRHEGRKAVLDFFKRSAVGTTEAGFEVERAFASGHHVVFTLTYRSTVEGPGLGLAAGEKKTIELPAVTILEVRDGKVSRHVDHVDYDGLLRQLEERG